jgi:sulfotransferase family protein
VTAERFQPDLLVEQACELAGSDDFGDDDTWRDGLARLSEGLVSEARLNDLGGEIAVLDIIRPLTSRLQIVKWRKENPDIAAQPVTRPIFIVGQPRTGTTILFDLLAQDPALRPPLTWEVDNPFPLPRPETYDTDPADRRNPGDHRDVRADRSGPAGVSSDGGVGWSGVCPHHRRPVLQHDLLGAVPPAQLLPVAAV